MTIPAPVLAIAAALAGLLFGIAVGWTGKIHLSAKNGPETNTAAAEEDIHPERAGGEIDRHQSPPVQPDAADVDFVDSAETVEPDFDAAIDLLDAAGLRLVPKRVLPRLVRGDIILNDGTLSRQTAELLRLSPGQVEAIDAAIQSTAERLALVQQDNVEILAESGDTMIFRLGGSPAEVASLREELQTRLVDSLGARDGAVLMDLISDPDGFFHGFTGEPLDVLFWVAAHESHTTPYFSVKPADPDAAPPARRGDWGKPLEGRRNTAAPTGRLSYLLPFLPAELQPHFVEHR